MNCIFNKKKMENDTINKKIQSLLDLIISRFKILPENLTKKNPTHYLIPARTVDNPNDIFILNTRPDFEGDKLPEYVLLGDERIYIRNYTPIDYLNNETTDGWDNISKQDLEATNTAISELTWLIHQYNVSGVSGTIINDTQSVVCVYVKYVGLLTLFDKPIPKDVNGIPVIVEYGVFRRHQFN